MFSLRFTIGLFLILLIPFGLRVLKLEPFPAILLPSGAGKIKVSAGRINVSSKALYGLQRSGKWKEINPKLFVKPAPVQYLIPIIESDLGFRRIEKNSFLKRFKIASHLFSSRQPSNKDIIELKKWLQQRLLIQGFNPDRIKIASYKITVSATNGNLIEKKIVNEKFFILGKESK